MSFSIMCAVQQTNKFLFLSKLLLYVFEAVVRNGCAFPLVLRLGGAPLGPYGKAQPFLTTGGEADTNDNMNLIAVLRRRVNDV